jgi:tRNA uridine 5-carboxymethylaminomethyl modification enzyme
MFSSRAEHRLLLRSDNADLRLMEIGFRLGLIDAAAMRRLESKRRAVKEVLDELTRRRAGGKDLLKILRQPEMNFAALRALDGGIAERDLPADAIEQIEIEAKYAAYIEREKAQVEKLLRLESLRIPDDFDFRSIGAIRIESREKLHRLRPRSVGQASRIPGVTPADMQVILVHLEARARVPGAR